MTAASRRSSSRLPRRPASSTRRTSTSATTRSTSTPATRRRRRARRRPARDRPLLPGLAAPRERLELAAAAGSRRGAPRGRRHRLPLARPDDLRHRPARRPSVMADLRPSSSTRHEPTGPVETFSTERADRRRRAARSRPRTRPRSCSASTAAPAAREHQPDQRRPEELAPVRDRRVRVGAWPGTPSSPTSRGSAIAIGPTRSSSGTRRSWARPARRPPPCRVATSKASSTRSAPISGPSTRTWWPGRPSSRPGYPTFADGHDEMLVNDAIAESAREGRWVDVDRASRHRAARHRRSAVR